MHSTKCVAVYAGDHHVSELQGRDGFGEIQRLVSVQRIRPPMPHIAKRAAARALVAHDHEGGRAFAEAFADIGARGFFADGVQLVLTQDLLDFIETRGGRTGFHANPIGLFEQLALLYLDGNTA
jgi:hypothetical protein